MEAEEKEESKGVEEAIWYGEVCLDFDFEKLWHLALIADNGWA